MSTVTGTATTLRPNKRYIATHDSSGKSIYAPSQEQVFNIIPNGGMARSYAVSSVPANLTNDADLKAYTSTDANTSYTKRDIVVPGGTGANLVVVDLGPGMVSAMHHTVSIDFSICVVGEIEHELDSGEKVTLYPGDHIVQRGTMHRWINPSKTEPARFVAVTLPCDPFEIAGRMLEEYHSKPGESSTWPSKI